MVFSTFRGGPPPPPVLVNPTRSVGNETNWSGSWCVSSFLVKGVVLGNKPSQLVNFKGWSSTTAVVRLAHQRGTQMGVLPYSRSAVLGAQKLVKAGLIQFWYRRGSTLVLGWSRGLSPTWLAHPTRCSKKVGLLKLW